MTSSWRRVLAEEHVLAVKQTTNREKRENENYTNEK